jgi:predicted Rdx family selenoprotein
MNTLETSFSIHLAPALPMEWLIFIGLAYIGFIAFCFYRRRRGSIFRAITGLVFMLALLNPVLLEEDRKPEKDTALIVLDKSPSQKFGQRTQRSEDALAYIRSTLEGREDLDLRIIEAPMGDTVVDETLLFESIDNAFADIPAKRRAGVMILSDGQIHDVPTEETRMKNYGPVHTLLSGEKNEKDRRLIVIEAPSYGIVGQNVTIKYRIDDTKNIPKSPVAVSIKRQNLQVETVSVMPGEEQTVELPIEHAGQNVFELSVAEIKDEITPANNRAALMVNGVRDRLRVLLVSGQPHAGGRTWRDLLTSDPSVDLVHFTILREPDKLDATPQNELSLIAFPFEELFEIKLYDFDLIVFDRYRLNRILPSHYFDNIVKYVREGGALLEASGPSFAGEDSIYFTSLMDILPGTPDGDVIRKPFIPALSESGLQHPVTSSLVWNGMSAGTTKPNWGPWLRQVPLKRESGEVLMSGADDFPLLILDRVEKGRVAQIASDHIWLWSRGYEGGGPHAELLRRIVHWLMKEPELDERALDIQVDGMNITLKSRDYKQQNTSVTMTSPNGDTQILKLEKSAGGFLETRIKADQIGIYSFDDTYGEIRYGIVGDLNPPELEGVISTPEVIAPLTQASGGGIIWLDDTPKPDIRFLNAGRGSYAGNSWIGLQRNREYSIQGVRQIPLMSEWFLLLMLGTALAFTWWYEGRR